MAGSFYRHFTGDEETLQEIKKTYEDKKYLLDTHTGVGCGLPVMPKGPGIKPRPSSCCTNPYKFNQAVLEPLPERRR